MVIIICVYFVYFLCQIDQCTLVMNRGQAVSLVFVRLGSYDVFPRTG